MSVLEIPRWPRTFILRHLDAGQDTIARDLGYPNWAAYVRFVEGDTMTTFPGDSILGYPRGRKATMVWTRTGEDVATCGIHFLRAEGADVQDFTNDDADTVQALLRTMWGSIKSYFDPSLALDRIVFHHWGVNVRRPNPASNEFVVSPAVAGTGEEAGQLPPQVACSVTLKTSHRKTWGRFYLPASVESTVGAGRFDVGYISAVRTAVGTLLDDAATDNLPMVVWSPRHSGGPLEYGGPTKAGREAAHAAGTDNPDTTSFARSVDKVQVDDVCDVIRSRRYSKPLLKETHSL